jgi:hypothetical protein
MPHDRDGIELHPGDIVSLPCKITGVDSHDEYINTALETVDPVFPENVRRHVLVNAKQVVLLSRAIDDKKNEGAISSPDLNLSDKKGK